MGFFTDTTVCIGCKACEVACKQWNDLPADGVAVRQGGSYDHTGDLSRLDMAPRPVRRAARALARSSRKRRSARSRQGGGGNLPSIPAAGAVDLVDAAQSAAGLVDVAEAVARWAIGCSCPTSASTAPTRAASTPARPAR